MQGHQDIRTYYPDTNIRNIKIGTDEAKLGQMKKYLVTVLEEAWSGEREEKPQPKGGSVHEKGENKIYESCDWACTSGLFTAHARQSTKPTALITPCK